MALRNLRRQTRGTIQPAARMVRPSRVIRRPAVPRRAPRPQPRYKKVGKVYHASNQFYDFSVQKIQNTKNIKDEQVVLGQKDKISKQVVWRVMSKQDYNRRFASRTPKGVVSMLAQHPDVFMHVGHAIIKNLSHFV